MRLSADTARATTVDSDVLLRALAICSVVWNHANPLALGAFGGGMTFLMMLSGFSFARFSLRHATAAQVRASLARLALRIGLPSLLLVTLYFVTLQRFDWKELLFISNWWTLDRIALFPTWYPQVMLQMFLLLGLLFLAPGADRWLRRPAALSLALFGGGLAMRLVLPLLAWDTAPLNHNLPHLYLWNFTLGWLVYFLSRDGHVTSTGRLASLTCIVAGGLAGWGWHRLDFWWLTIAGSLFVLLPRIPMPRGLATAAGLLSQSAFTIFLLHRGLFVVLDHIVPAWKQREPLLHFLFAIVMSVGFWILLASIGRAWREMDRQPEPQAVSRPHAAPMLPTAKT